MRLIILGFTLSIILFSAFSFNDSFANITPNKVISIDGSGFAVTKETVQTSEIDLILSTQNQIGSSIKTSVVDKTIILGIKDIKSINLEATFLREGKYIRITGVSDSNNREDIGVSLFGRLVGESKDASVYGFTGRIIIDNLEYRIIYTAKLSDLFKINVTPSSTNKPNDSKTIQILKGSSTQGADSYIGLSLDPRFRYFSQDRISIEPGTTITFVNNDTVTHQIISGKENYNERYNQFTADGRISTGEILPGQSSTILFSEAGFYRLYDPNYQWMKIVAYVFPNVDQTVLGSGKKQN